MTQVREILALLGDDKALTERLAEFAAGVADFVDEEERVVVAREDLRLETEKIAAARADLQGLEAQEKAVQAERARLEAHGTALHRGEAKLQEDREVFGEEKARLKLSQSQLARDNTAATEAGRHVAVRVQEYAQAVSRMKNIADSLAP